MRHARTAARIALALALSMAAAASPAGATTLYKWVSPDGVVNFSDLPPPGGAQTVSLPGYADEMPTLPVARLDELSQTDEAIARANTRVDLAEHALAVARRPLWSPHDGLRIPAGDPPPSDAQQRSQFYMSDVLKARRELMDTLRRKAQPAPR